MTDHAYWRADAASRALARSLLREVLSDAGAQQSTPPDDALEPLPPRVYWSHSRILTALRQFYAKEGRVPRRSDWLHAKAAGLPSEGTICRHFPSRAEAYTAAGLPSAPPRKPWTARQRAAHAKSRIEP